jgi:iron(III) transport system ATP-binding protein
MSKNFFEIKNVDFNIDGKTKVKNVSFSIENEGDVICLLGPSGIGKTTILRTIAGLERIKKGSIELNGKVLSSEKINIEPENRNVSLAFQDNSLFPHYDVQKNILLGSEKNKEKIEKKIDVKEIIDLLDISHILNKYPHEISAGEAQRASLARSLMTRPDLLLLDEPLSNVTHDSYEAFYLGSKCGIILNQELKQFDDPYNVYHLPNSIEVVNFLNRGILIPAEVTSPKSLENKDLGTITGNFNKPFPIGSKVKLLVQPEDLHHDDQSNLKFEVVDRKFRGTNFIYTLKTPSDLLIPVFVHSHHIHQHEENEKFGIKRPIHIDHIVCF